MKIEEKEFLKKAVKNGKVLTNLGHLLGPVTHQTVKQVTKNNPYGEKEENHGRKGVFRNAEGEGSKKG